MGLGVAILEIFTMNTDNFLNLWYSTRKVKTVMNVILFT